MRDPRRCALHLLLDAPPRRGPEAARPHRARRDRSARGQPWPLRRAQDKGGAVAGRHNRQSQAHLPDNEGNGLVSAYGSKRFKRHRDVPNGADVPNVVARRFGGRAPRTHACSDLTYVRVGGGWNCVCLLVDLRNREIMGHSAGPRKDADLVRAEFVYREAFGTTRELQVKLADYVHWYNNFRLHSTLGYMASVEFRKAGLVLSELPK